MKIRVLFFAQLKENFGAERVLEAPEGMTVGRLATQLTAVAAAALPLVYAVNENFVLSDQTLQDGDTLALMTPMSGG